MFKFSNLIKLNIFILLFIVFAYFFTNPCSASKLYLEPESGQYYAEDIFIVEVRIDTEGEFVNTIEANIGFPSEFLEVLDISTGSSILNLLIRNPSFSEKEASFVGGIPGGYQGLNGLVGKIVFRAKKENNSYSPVFFKNTSKVLLNDGRGSESNLSLIGGGYTFLSDSSKELKNEWQEETRRDEVLPEPFEITINQDSKIFDGKYFIVFFTTDKQTGIDYYEVKEGGRDWEKTNSPYVLKDQDLSSVIRVRAIDKAGNYWMASLDASNSKNNRFVVWFVIFCFLFLFILFIIRKRNNVNSKI